MSSAFGNAAAKSVDNVRFFLRSCGSETAFGAIFAAFISFAGQQNPTCGTTPFFGAKHGTQNLHDINVLRATDASGTAVAKRFRVVESTSRPYCIQLLPL
jgi:hypothetical protein